MEEIPVLNNEECVELKNIKYKRGSDFLITPPILLFKY